jgi:hypothetical protein
MRPVARRARRGISSAASRRGVTATPLPLQNSAGHLPSLPRNVWDAPGGTASAHRGTSPPAGQDDSSPPVRDPVSPLCWSAFPGFSRAPGRSYPRSPQGRSVVTQFRPTGGYVSSGGRFNPSPGK